jgi:hypothetical protein
MPFVSAKDPRVPSVQNPKFGFDGSTPYDGQLVFPAFNSPVPVANYVDAQLILAESQLAANDAGWLATLNALRTGPTSIGAVTVSGMSALTDPGNAGARIDLLFRERAFWLYATGHRLGDLRRLARAPYGRSIETIYPTGTYTHTNTVYGSNTELPVTFDERNNPNFTGCDYNTP